jgi:hypothetical protein
VRGAVLFQVAAVSRVQNAIGESHAVVPNVLAREASRGSGTRSSDAQFL